MVEGNYKLFLKGFFKQTHDNSILIFDLAGNLIYCNSRAVGLFGYDNKDELFQKTIQDIVPEDYAKLLPDIITGDYLTNGAFAKRVHKRKDGFQFATYLSSEYVTINGNKRILFLIKDRSHEIAGYSELKIASLRQNVEILKCQLEIERSTIALLKENFNHDDILVHEQLCAKLSEKHSNLNQVDFKVCSLIFLKFESGDIATKLNIELNSVYMSRKRLRKKLCLTKGESLLQYLIELMQ